MPETPPLHGRVVVAGSTMIDMTSYCDRFPDDGETLVGREFRQGFGGKGANQAVMASRLGSEVTFVGAVGSDTFGDETLSNLEDRGIDVAGVARIEDAVSGIAPIWVDRHGTNRILVMPGANQRLTPDHIEAALVSATADVVLSQLETPQPATIAAFRWARANGAATILNPAPAAELLPALVGLADWIIPNESEFEAMYGDEPSDTSLAAAAEAWDANVVVTQGELGAIASVDSEVHRIPARRVEVLDTTGAGDAFVGAFAVALASGLSALEAVELGCVCGALSVTRAGTQQSLPSKREVLTAWKESARTTEGTGQ